MSLLEVFYITVKVACSWFVEKNHHTSKRLGAPAMQPHWTESGLRESVPAALLPQRLLEPPSPSSPLPSLLQRIRFPVSHGNRNIQQRLPPFPNRPSLSCTRTHPHLSQLPFWFRAGGRLAWPRLCVQVLSPPGAAAFSPAAFTKACSSLCRLLPKTLHPTPLLDPPFSLLSFTAIVL